MSSDKSYKCPYCMLLLSEEERQPHIDSCDRIFYYHVRFLEDVSGSVNCVGYEYKQGETARLGHDLYRQLRGKCERITEDD